MKSLLKKLVLALMVFGGAGYGHHVWETSLTERSTENAYLNADRVQIGSQVSGVVKAVHVHDGQFVEAGAPLFDIDAEPFRVAEALALARLAEAEQAHRESAKEVEAVRASVAQAEADLTNATNAAHRVHKLVQQNFLSAQTVEDADARVTMAEAAVAEAKARLDRALAHVATVEGATPAMMAARAALAQARLDLANTQVKATQSGWLAHFSLVKGSLVNANTPLFAQIVKDSFWVDANFKETELPGIKPGQAVHITLDILPDQPLTGVVDTITSGTGAAFSLLPPQNATGNWVKVVQRVPVRIRLENSAFLQPLLVGASAEVRVQLKG